MLEFFKKNHLFNSLLLLPYALVIRLVVILFSSSRVPGQVFGTWGQDVLLHIQQWGMGEYMLSTLLIFVQAAMINRLMIRQSMTGEINLFPGLCYVLITALHPSYIGMSSVLLANTTLLIALGYFFDVLKKERQEETRFMGGLWLAVSALLYTPYLVLIIFGLLAMSMLKTLKLKDIFQYLTGFISPFLITWMVRMIQTGELQPGFPALFSEFGFPGVAAIYDIADVITLSVMSLLLLVSLLGYTQIIARKNIHAQKKIDTMYALVFFGAVMALWHSTVTVQFLFVLMIPFSLFSAIVLRMIRHPAIAESIHFILFVAALLTQVLFLV